MVYLAVITHPSALASPPRWTERALVDFLPDPGLLQVHVCVFLNAAHLLVLLLLLLLLLLSGVVGMLEWTRAIYVRVTDERGRCIS